MTEDNTIKFKSIAVAFCFSPTLRYIIEHANKISKVYNANMTLIHVGEVDDEKKNQLDAILNDNGISKKDIKIIWDKGKIENVILKKVEENSIDLLILGALKKENLITYYMGSVARNLSRYSKCSTLILSKIINLKNFDTIIVNSNKENQVKLSTSSLYLANKLNSKNVYITREIFMPRMNILEDTSDDEINKIKDNYISEATENYNKNLKKIKDEISINEDLKITFKALIGKKGYKISAFAKEINPELLVISQPKRKFGFIDRIFTNDIEFILSELPCNLLILHNR